jgi:hypothetical protein
MLRNGGRFALERVADLVRKTQRGTLLTRASAAGSEQGNPLIKR